MAQVATSRPPLSLLEEILRKHWGFPAFRPAQVEVVLAGAAGGNTLAILPTGGGKSICYQVPGLYRGGVCLVVSPLVALMRDQVEGLRKRGLPAAALTSGMPRPEVERLLDNFRFGPGGFLFVAPERLAQAEFGAACKGMDVRTIAIDEAHCISQWGHAFRSDYLTIGVLREWHPKAGWIALTATATEAVADDIERLMGMTHPHRIRMPLRRDNLAFSVCPVRDRYAAIIDWAHRLEGSAILYVRTRRDAESMAAMLAAHGIRAAAYHAGMPRALRDDHQEAWVRGEYAVLACTTAFGMGIDKPDVRHIAHAHVPETPEAYIQEAGRAGRDGLPSAATLFLDATAEHDAARFVESQWPDQEDVRKVLQAMANVLSLATGSTMETFEEVSVPLLARKSGCTAPQVRKCVDLMERSGWLETRPADPAVMVRWSLSPAELTGRVGDFGADSVMLQVLLSAHAQRGRNAWRFNATSAFQAAGCSPAAGWQHLKRLSEHGALEMTTPDDRLAVRFHTGRPDVRSARIPATHLEQRKAAARNRWDQMQAYLHVETCRARALESHFDDAEQPPCGICDRCAPPSAPSADTVADWIGQGIAPLELQRLVPVQHRDNVQDLLERWRNEGRLTLVNHQLRLTP